MKTAEELAAEVDNEIRDEGGAGNDDGDAGGQPQGGAAGNAGAGEEDFSDDDLDYSKIEAAAKAPKPLDNAGILKRYKKVHGKWKDTEGKLKGYSWVTPDSQKRLQTLDVLLGGLNKMRSKDAADKEGALEILLDQIMQGKITDPRSAHKALGDILGPEDQAPGGQKPQQLTPELEALKAEIAELKKGRDEDREGRAQQELNSWMRDAFAAVPKQLNSKPEFKELPWKDKAWREEFDDLLEEKVIVWTSRNADKVDRGERPPMAELAESVAKVFIRGGHNALKRQVDGGDGKKFGLTRSQNPGGSNPRQLPKAGDDNAEGDYLRSLAAEVEEELRSQG